MLSAQLLRLHDRAALNGSADTSRQSPRSVVPEIPELQGFAASLSKSSPESEKTCFLSVLIITFIDYGYFESYFRDP
jgi:hypothetical protein